MELSDLREGINESHGLCCYGHEDDPRIWSLWRESDDTQLTPWIDLGPQGLIWVLWNDGDEYMLVLEQRDDAATPPVLRQALMHLPSGRQTDFVFAGDRDFETQRGVECVDGLGNQTLLVLTFPHDFEARTDVYGAALYDKQLRELVGPCIAWAAPCYVHPNQIRLALRRADDSVDHGVLDHVEARFIIPAEYQDVTQHGERWCCLRRDGQTDWCDAQGRLLARYDYALHGGYRDDRLYAERKGLWGWADTEGRLLVEPYAPDSAVLDAEVRTFTRLSLEAAAAPALCLADDSLAALIEAVGDEGLSLKYEGVPRAEGGDGMLDAGLAELPGAVPAVLLEDRWSTLKLLVLKAPWRKQPAGTVLALQGRSRARTVARGGAEDIFLQVVFAQTIEMD